MPWVGHFFILIFPTAVLALQQNWDVSYAELLKYGSFGVMAYGVATFPAGWLADRWSSRGMMNLFFYGMGLSAILTAFAQTPEQLAAGVIAIGLFAAIYHPVGIALVFSTSGKTGRAIAVNGVAGNIGLALAAVVTAWLSQMISWQAAFWIPGVICILTGFAYTWVSKDIKPVKHSKKNQQSMALNKDTMIRMFLCIAVIAGFGGLVFQSLTTAMPKVLESSFGASLGKTGIMATFIFAIAAVVQLIIGELLDRVSARVLLLVITGAQVVFLLLSALTSGWLLLPVLTGLMFSSYAQIPVNDWLIGKYATNEWRSRVYALKYTLSSSTGPIAYWMIASIYDDTGAFVLLFQILASVMCFSVIAAWMLPSFKSRTLNGKEAYA